jgi:uncharacterized membrane protein YdjX (TVP38/TMEM64 family)
MRRKSALDRCDQQKQDMSEKVLGKAKRWFAIVAAGVIVLSLLVSIGTSHWIAGEITDLVNRVANEGWYGQVTFLILLTIVCLTGIFPASMLAIAAGTIYGFDQGTLLSGLGLSIGGIVGFLAARFLFRDMAKPWISRRSAFQKIDEDIAQQGWRVVVLLRLSPVAPFGITSYALGLTRLRFVDYLVGTVGSLPAMMAYVYMGYLTRQALYVSSGTVIPWLKLGVMGLGVAATIVAAVHFYRILNGARRISSAR